jgi:hypothetical protein
MMVRKAAVVAGILAGAVQSIAPSFGDQPRVFAPAFYDSGSVGHEPPKLHVFPLDGQSFTIRLPFQIGKLVASPDGEVLYGSRFLDRSEPNTGLYKIEFGPVRRLGCRARKGWRRSMA